MIMEGNKAPWQLLGEEFVKQYYNIFDANREQLAVLYSVRARSFTKISYNFVKLLLVTLVMLYVDYFISCSRI